MSINAHSQTTKNPGFGGSMGSQEICSQLGFSDDAEVIGMVDKILDYAGVVNHSYEVRGCTNASGCFATVINNQQYIVYQPDYLKTIKTYGFTGSSLPSQDKDWQALTILAHEVGHLINSHFYNCPQNLTIWQKELQADEFAGKIIYHLGGSLDQAQSVYNTSIVPDEGSMTHPPRADRLAAVKKGYENAQRLFPRINNVAVQPTNIPVKTPDQPVENPSGPNIEMVNVEGGSFEMGSNKVVADPEGVGGVYSDEYPKHTVTLSSFKMSKYEVTQAEWTAVMGTNPSHFKNCAHCPAENVSWMDVQDFLKKLNTMTGKKYRLPTEAEWEYAAKGGQNSNNYIYSGSKHIEDVCWYKKNSGNETHLVGQKQPNELGIYDMAGNVYEWCSDVYKNDYVGSKQTNPQGPGGVGSKVVRGGSWAQDPCINTNRDQVKPEQRSAYVGFRIVASK